MVQRRVRMLLHQLVLGGVLVDRAVQVDEGAVAVREGVVENGLEARHLGDLFAFDAVEDEYVVAHRDFRPFQSLEMLFRTLSGGRRPWTPGSFVARPLAPFL